MAHKYFSLKFKVLDTISAVYSDFVFSTYILCIYMYSMCVLTCRWHTLWSSSSAALLLSPTSRSADLYSSSATAAPPEHTHTHRHTDSSTPAQTTDRSLLFISHKFLTLLANILRSRVTANITGRALKPQTNTHSDHSAETDAAFTGSRFTSAPSNMKQDKQRVPNPDYKVILSMFIVCSVFTL